MMPELGSRLWQLGQARPSSRRSLARAYCTEALRELPVTVVDVILDEPTDGRVNVRVKLDYNGQRLEGEVAI